MTIYGFLALCLIGGIFAEIEDQPSTSLCPNIETPTNFNMSRYIGRWYEAKRYYIPYETNVKCGFVDFMGNDNRLEMIQSWLSVENEEPNSITAIVRQSESEDPAKLQIKIPSMPSTGWTDYWILGTDYETYAVVYNCKIIGDSSTTHAWILTRKRRPSKSVIAKALRIAEKHTLDKSNFMVTDQTGCREK